MLITESAMEHGHVSLLILGAGWTSTFLIPRLEAEHTSYAATTTDGRDGTIPFKFDPDAPDDEDLAQFKALPYAKTVLIVFPLKGTGPAAKLVRQYAASHPDGEGEGEGPRPRFIQFGVTSIWTAKDAWSDDDAPYDGANARAVAEDELMGCARASVLCLAGLYGGARQPRNWVDRVVRTKADLRAKGALHVVHGEDVARAVVALHRNFTPGKRWLLCDMHIYDWWDLVQDWAIQTLRDDAATEAQTTRQKELLSWVGELMVEEGVRALPRDSTAVGRRLDGRAFWQKMGIWPTQGRIR
ncbi:hypothetical protein F5Y15DRAFT_427144 [Xylariaceae sp. FL0016]|nr:hypothetical protein F5Y15DRAFT_427144 [Xylariaceae sp. FL0016]